MGWRLILWRLNPAWQTLMCKTCISSQTIQTHKERTQGTLRSRFLAQTIFEACGQKSCSFWISMKLMSSMLPSRPSLLPKKYTISMQGWVLLSSIALICDKLSLFSFALLKLVVYLQVPKTLNLQCNDIKMIFSSFSSMQWYQDDIF